MLCFWYDGQIIAKISYEHSSFAEVVATRHLLADERDVPFDDIRISFE